MGIRAGTHTLGPDSASLEVRTYREGGVLSKAGHDLIIDVRDWEATLELGEEGSSLRLRADPRSLHPREGLHGIKPLTDRDRDEIRKNIEEKVVGAEPVEFRSSAVEAPARDAFVTVSDTATSSRRWCNGTTTPTIGLPRPKRQSPHRTERHRARFVALSMRCQTPHLLRRCGATGP